MRICVFRKKEWADLSGKLGDTFVLDEVCGKLSDDILRDAKTWYDTLAKKSVEHAHARKVCDFDLPFTLSFVVVHRQKAATRAKVSSVRAKVRVARARSAPPMVKIAPTRSSS